MKKLYMKKMPMNTVMAYACVQGNCQSVSCPTPCATIPTQAVASVSAEKYNESYVKGNLNNRDN